MKYFLKINFLPAVCNHLFLCLYRFKFFWNPSSAETGILSTPKKAFLIF